MEKNKKEETTNLTIEDFKKFKETSWQFDEKKFVGELNKWYKKMLNVEAKYVVFMDYRTYDLALAIGKVQFEEISSAQFLTHSAMLLHCKELAIEYQKNKRFPLICMCLDVLSLYGRDFNHFMLTIYQQLYLLLPEYEKREIREELDKKILIVAYARKTSPQNLLVNFEFSIRVNITENPRIINSFSKIISRFVLYKNCVHRNYIYTEGITKSQFDKLKLEEYIQTSYQNIKQWIKIEFIGDKNEKVGVFTLRIVKHMDEEKYRVLPFIFIPNLGEIETKNLLKFIQTTMLEAEISDEYVKRLNVLEQISGKRTFNEMITLLLSHAVIQEFNKKNEIIIQKQENDMEIVRLARNYNMYNLEDSKKWLHAILDKQIFMLDDIRKMLNKVVNPTRKMTSIIDYSKQQSIFKEKIRNRIEDYFYIQISKEEREMQNVYGCDGEFIYKMITQREVRGCGFLLNEINDGYTEMQAKYSIAYFLQMFDTGILSISSYAPISMKVLGFSQFVRAEEQAQYIWPLRHYEWIPMLALMEKKGEWIDRSLKYVLKKYVENSCPDPELTFEVYEELNKMTSGEFGIYWKKNEVIDWFCYDGCRFEYQLEIHSLDIPEELGKIEKINKFIEKQIKHVDYFYEYFRENSQKLIWDKY